MMASSGNNSDEGYEKFINGLPATRQDLVNDPEAVKKQISLFDEWIQKAYDPYSGKDYFHKMASVFISSRNHLARYLKEHFNVDEPQRDLDYFWKKCSPPHKY